MLYKYEYVQKHTIYRLNQHLNYFFRRIRPVSKRASFNVSKYFHSEFADDINNSPVLKEKFRDFFNSFKILETHQKETFYKMVLKCSSIKSFYEDISIDCQDINNSAIKKLIGNDSLYALAKYLFSTTIKTSKWKIEDHYQQIYNTMPSHKACPFCGIGEMHQTFREDYDHLAAKKIYPLLAINLANLAPMCNPCNTKFKGEIDIFYKKKVRRPFAYPYTTQILVTIDYTGSIIPETDYTNTKGLWKINYDPQNEINCTWYEVFKIEKRYREDYLEPKFDSWVNDFIDELIDFGVKLKDKSDLKKELIKTSKRLHERVFVHSNIIRAPLFDFLANCNNDIFYSTVLKMYTTKSNKRNAA